MGEYWVLNKHNSIKIYSDIDEDNNERCNNEIEYKERLKVHLNKNENKIVIEKEKNEFDSINDKKKEIFFENINNINSK